MALSRVGYAVAGRASRMVTTITAVRESQNAMQCCSSVDQLFVGTQSSLVGTSSNRQQKRFLNVHEFQGAELLSSFGVNVPRGMAANTIDEAESSAQLFSKNSSDGEVVVKAQVLAGGRGKGTFKNGFEGGVHMATADNVRDIASKMLGETLVTKQTGEEGKPCNMIYIAEKLSLAREMYFAILLDRSTAGAMVVSCSEGGTSIEDLAEKFPEKIIKVPVDIREGMTPSQAAAVVEGLKVKGDANAAMDQVMKMFKCFCECDATLLEVNPLAETTVTNTLIAADAKLNFDDNASFRQKAIFEMRDTSQEDPREVRASKVDLNYIGLDGEIGCMVNGAGLAMATMDIIKMHGGTPANFLDVGGSASEEQVVEAFKILTADPRVKAILVNIFGGIMKCDVIAAGIVNAAREVGVEVPLVVRLEGTNVDEGKRILKESALNILRADDLDDAAMKAVASIK